MIATVSFKEKKMKTPKDILLGASKVVLYAGASASLTALISYLQELSGAMTGITLIVINLILYVLVQMSQNYFKK